MIFIILSGTWQRSGYTKTLYPSMKPNGQKNIFFISELFGIMVAIGSGRS
jgi:hypothetical protein